MTDARHRPGDLVAETPALRAPLGFAPDWPAPPGVHAWTTERAGGVSAGPYAAFNLGAHVGDRAADVAANRRRLRAGLALPAEPVWLDQVHGSRVVEIGDARAAKGGAAHGAAADAAARAAVAAADAARAVAAADARAVADTEAAAAAAAADAAVTSVAGVVCAVMTADCLPVLLCDRAGHRVAAAHAGWRGLAAGVLPAAVAALRCAPREVLAWLGPAIGPSAYEVGAEVRDALAASAPGAARCVVPNARGRFQADLYGVARASLAAAGVACVYGGGFCTFSEPERFFSHRREAPCGRMATLIWRG